MPAPGHTALLPGSTIGVLGGGQLGRMLCAAARDMGYRCVVFDASEHSPAGDIADRHICADWDDTAALQAFAEDCDIITIEFENIPADAVRTVAERCRVYPDVNALEIAQHRAREKQYAREAGLRPAPYSHIRSHDELGRAVDSIGLPAVLKSATLGYDGKGQVVVRSIDEAVAALQQMGAVESVLEQLVDIETEISVIVARNARGETACYQPGENVHVDAILHTSTLPANVPAAILDQAVQQATALAVKLGYIGVMTVEFFISRQGELLFNEFAPRTHNSGHYTMDACATSQFAQQVRVICGLPPGDTRLLSPVVMVNLLGDLWEPDWSALLQQPGIKLHLYGKKQARPGRKMGHFNVLAADRDTAVRIARDTYEAIRGD